MTSTDHDDPAEAQAPPVVVTVVTREAGPWLEECLASLAAQDYPNLSVLVVATGPAEDLLGRVAAILPSAFVRRLEGDLGFGPAANDVLEVVEGAAFYAFCHDDVILEAHAIRALVEEAYRSNAGIVGPKLVRWHEPEHLLAVGVNVDKVGMRTGVVERGELDQEQHDAVRDVFLIPGGCTLVRADLFATLGGFDPGIDLFGEDLDLCWRAQVAGARVVVVPGARVEHRESMADRSPEHPEELADRHRLRTVLTCYGRFHLLRVLPQLVLLSIGEVVHAVGSGRRQRAREHLAAWRWNLRRWGEIRKRRRALHKIRQLPDREVRRLQIGGSVQVSSFLRGDLHVTERLRLFSDLGHELSESLHSGPRRIVVATWTALIAVFLLGSRGLLFQRLPVVGNLAPFDAGVGHLLGDYLRAWRHAGLGADAPQPTAFALLGLAGIPFLGGMGLLQQVLVLGCIPVGWIGAWRVTKPLGSRLGRASGLLVYAVSPLPYDALARGGWGALLVYAAAPWILNRLIAACGDLPSAHGPVIRRRDVRAVLALGVLVALVAAFVPVIVLLVPLVALGVFLGGVLTRGGRRTWSAVVVAVGASVVAVVLHIPWTFDFTLPGSTWWAIGGVGPVLHQGLGMGALVRFDTGAGHTALGWALPVAAALPLLIGREWRFAWAVRCWCVALVCWGVAWAGGQGLLGVPVPSADVLLAPVAAALALSVGLGVLAFERDLRGYHFGWRQVASLVAAAAVLVSIVPVLGAVLDGRWGLPSTDHATLLSFLDDRDARQAGDFRVLWLGAPEVLPVAPFRLTDDLAYGIAENGSGSFTERWASPAYGSTPIVADDLRVAGHGDTVRLGSLLGRYGIRYLVVTDRLAPAHATSEVHPVPAGLDATLARQLDLRRLDGDPALVVYQNTAWTPVHAASHGRTVPRLLAVLLQVLLWAGAVVFLVARRQRRQELIG